MFSPRFMGCKAFFLLPILFKPQPGGKPTQTDSFLTSYELVVIILLFQT